jgi:hypothetical protein
VYWYSKRARPPIRMQVSVPGMKKKPAPDGADADVVNRGGLAHRKVGSLCPGDRAETCGRPEEKALHELHVDLQS